ncbi:MAG: phosphoribosyl transferase [Cellulomonas sp. 73-145]|uniref:phosphoribosyltransferase family protein n=1 Tax=Cellulomonas sp. 73-145 TaxID=1895739 RepID=UPI00092BC1C8|nr:phosphoribosyltransferase family protein [Cellulomonas sp. 73-145]OJV58744.1 MAG: phosphoribosyl transferase [Cellulomonas sp. 73-145]
MTLFADRVDAGRALARLLEPLRGQGVVVLGLPRGGVPVAYEVAQTLGAPLDVIVVRKLGVPFQPELAMGAIGEGGARVLDHHVLTSVGVPEDDVAEVERRERIELDSRVARLRSGRARVDLTGRVAVVVDDGIATGSTMRVACTVARSLGAARVVAAVPVAPADVVQDLREADEVVCVATPRTFRAVGAHYRDFSSTTDDEVVLLLDAAAARAVPLHPCTAGTDADEDVVIPVGGPARSVTVGAHLYLPEPAVGVVVFAHGSGSSRHSPRNRYVAEVLREAGLGTLLLDLLSPEEELDRSNVFDVELLAGRLVAATRWLQGRPDAASCRIGYFGASTGAAAALWAAAGLGAEISAVVSRGGRPDLARARLAEVRAPTLLIVGGADTAVLDLNRQAAALLRCPQALAVVGCATHLFEEPGALDEVAALARDWFTAHLLRIPPSG